MKIKFDFRVTPDGYDGIGPDKAQHVKGSVEIPRGPLYAVIAAIMSCATHPMLIGFNAAGNLLEKVGKEVADG